MEALVGDEQYGGFLKSRDAMRDFCREHPESALDHGFFSFGFRADTAQYAYLIRLHPYKAEENLFIYCYRHDWLDRHMEQAEKGIRFIDPHYNELFRIPDGGQIRILREGCAPIDRTCRYIDDCHVEVGEWLGQPVPHLPVCRADGAVPQRGDPPDAAPAGEVLYRSAVVR